jgi:hypothetical protein
MNGEFKPRHGRSGPSGLILGVGVILVGVVLLLGQVPGIRETRIPELLVQLWPLILVAMGLARMQDGSRPARGWVLIVAGLVLLAVTLGHGRFDALIWPGILLGAGILIVLRTLRRQREIRPGPVDSEDYLRGTAVLSGIKRQYRSQAFQGGELTAIFGGMELDLRDVAMAGDSAPLDLFLLFGGGEIRVPEHWEVVVNATTIAGGLGDKDAPGPGSAARPRLVLSGLILFGGVEIKR